MDYIKFYFIGYILAFGPVLCSQADTLLSIDTVLVSEANLNPIRKTGYTKIIWGSDPTEVQNNLLQNGVNVRSYGPSGIASLTIRGGNANHTAYSWNGTNINNPMLGQNDLAILPLHLFPSVVLYKGSESALVGSGAIAGGLDLSNSSRFEDSSNLNFSLASFGNRYVSTAINKKFGNWSLDLKGDVTSNKNRFRYPLNKDFSRLNEHGENNQQNVMVNLSHKAAKNHESGIRYWFTNAFRNLPATKQQSRSLANLKDRANRLQVYHNSIQSHFVNLTQLTLLSESNEYHDALIQENSLNHFDKYVVENRLKFYWRDFRFFSNQMFESNQGSSKFYKLNAKLDLFTLVAGLQYQKARFEAELLARKSIGGTVRNQPLVPDLSLTYRNKGIELRGRIQGGYRLPTLNERFWVPGGNPELLPESSWSGDLQFSFTKSQITASASVYHRRTKNWVYWVPDGQFISQATNIAQVYSRGLELFLDGKILSSLRLTSNFVMDKSTNEVELSFPKLEKGSQVFYTPLFQGSVGLTYCWKNWESLINLRYVGQSVGLNKIIDPYALTDIGIKFKLNGVSSQNSIAFHIYNVFNKDYETIENRAMPGRSFNLSLFLSPEW